MGQAGVSAGPESFCKVTSGRRTAPVVVRGRWWEPSGSSTAVRAAAPKEPELERPEFGEGRARGAVPLPVCVGTAGEALQSPTSQYPGSGVKGRCRRGSLVGRG